MANTIKRAIKKSEPPEIAGTSETDYFERPFLVIHTLKAVKAGSPADRVLVVVCQQRVGRHLYYGAYKCVMTTDGLEHPASQYATAIKLSDTKFWAKVGVLNPKNGAQPTASIRMDSFYREVSLAELDSSIAALAKGSGRRCTESNASRKKRSNARFEELINLGWNADDFQALQNFPHFVGYEKLHVVDWYGEARARGETPLSTTQIKAALDKLNKG